MLENEKNKKLEKHEIPAEKTMIVSAFWFHLFSNTSYRFYIGYDFFIYSPLMVTFDKSNGYWKFD